MQPDREGRFATSAQRVLAHLDETVARGTWLLLRAREDGWVVLHEHGRADAALRGQVLSLEASLLEGLLTEGALFRTADEPRRWLQARTGDAPLDPSPLFAAGLGRTADEDASTLLCGLVDGREQRVLADPSLAELSLLADLLAELLAGERHAASMARNSERFRYEAMTDALTHLPNRRAWEEKLSAEHARAGRLGESSFISVVDLDDLKETNDREGHAAGDQLLRRAGLVLRYAVRDSDFVARVGGDEFAVLGMQCGAIEEGDLSARIEEALHRSGIQASVGTAIARPAQTHGEIWAEADSAMYRAKKRRNRISH